MSKPMLITIMGAGFAMALLLVLPAIAQGPGGGAAYDAEGGAMRGPGGPPGHGPGAPFPRPQDLDANQDGTVTREEYQAGWNTFLEAQFTKLDADSSGSLSKAEFAARKDGPRRERPEGSEGDRPRGPRPEGAAMGERGKGGPPEGRPRGMGMRPPSPVDMDKDQDGNVTHEEFLSAWTPLRDTGFTKMDADGDGALSAEELAQCGPPPGRSEGGERGGYGRGGPR